MAPEKVTVTIRSSVVGDAPLTVSDGLCQIVDFFALLDAAGGKDGSTITWQLVAVQMQSPLTATAVAVAKAPGVIAAEVARLEKAAVSHSIEELVRSSRVPEWMDSSAREKAKRLFLRNMNGIVRTDINLYDDAPPTIIIEQTARVAVETLEKYEKENEEPKDDLSRTEMGSIEANVLDATTYRNQPAIRIRERLSKEELICVFSDDLAKRIGPQHSWAEVWANRRVLLFGEIIYRKDGTALRIYAHDIEDVDPKPLKYHNIADPNFTGGLSVSDYLASLWEDDVG